jgi:prolyl 4-hydroxylase
METGTVKWFNNSKSYGLIFSDEGKEIPIFNYTNGLLLEGQKVKFNCLQKDTLITATDLTIVDSNFNKTAEKSNKFQETILHDYPRISLYDNVLSDNYCDSLIQRSLSPTYPGKYISMNDHRTDCQYDTYGQASHRNIYRRILNDFTYQDYDVIATACSEALGRPYHLIESADILYYHEGHYMTPHHDWPYDPRKLDYYQKGGTRDAVALIYLNDNFQGGETYFPHLDISIKPKKGSMSVWNHTQEVDLDWLLLHESKEIVKGEKFAIIFCLSSLPRNQSKGY